jgi:hypothetical protein
MKAKNLNSLRLCLAFTFALCASALAESFWEKVLRITGVSATPSLQKGGKEDMPAGGQIWIADLRTEQRRKLTAESGYRSPVFTPDGHSVLALKSNEIWRIPLAGGSAQKVHALPGLSKLVGFSREDTNELCLLVEQAQQVSVVLLALTSGQATLLEYDKEDRQSRRMITQLKGWERQYGGTNVYPARQQRKSLSGNIQWDDIFVKRAEEDATNVSQSNGVNCGHPSLSPSGKEIVFIKATESAGR